jgi:hypothetical protein
MDQRSWLHAVPVLQQIGAVRTALISVANDSGDALREAVTEKFARSFLARDGLAAHLTDWAENTHTTDIDREHARALLSALDDAREKASGNSDGLANTSAAASPTLPASSEFEELERWAEFARSRSLTGKLEDVFLSIDEELSTHPDYRGDVKADCRSIVHHLILYMAHCLDVTPRMADAGYGFLFDLDGTKPLELDLQRSLWTNFRLQNHGFPQHQILREVQDVGAGRADIAIVRSTWRPVLELKREPNNASRENIRAYLGQAAAYELTGPRIGFLVVLDVCSQKDWALTIEDNVWVERVQSSDDSQPRLITVWRIPGMRTTPSSVKTPNGG